MERNIGGVDRIIRLVIGAIMTGVGFGALGGVVGIVVGVIGVILLLTSALGQCIIYRFLNINTYIRV